MIYIYTGVYLTFTTGGKIWKTADHIDFHSLHGKAREQPAK